MRGLSVITWKSGPSNPPLPWDPLFEKNMVHFAKQQFCSLEKDSLFVTFLIFGDVKMKLSLPSWKISHFPVCLEFFSRLDWEYPPSLCLLKFPPNRCLIWNIILRSFSQAALRKRQVSERVSAIWANRCYNRYKNTNYKRNWDRKHVKKKKN